MSNGTLNVSQIDLLTQSGTGTLSIVPPNTNTNRTLTLPDSTGALLTDSTLVGGSGISITSAAGITTISLPTLHYQPGDSGIPSLQGPSANFGII